MFTSLLLNLEHLIISMAVLVINAAICVLVQEQDGLVHYLLQLVVLQVGPHHHLQHLDRARDLCLVCLCTVHITLCKVYISRRNNFRLDAIENFRQRDWQEEQYRT